MTVPQLKATLAERPPHLRGITRSYGILVPLVQGEDGLSLLFEVRARTLRRQPLEVCFPGGAIEEGEDPQEGAHREFCEELGLPAQSVEILAPLSHLYHRDNSLILPFVGMVIQETVEQAQPNLQEVDHLFHVPLSYFLTTQPEVYRYHLESKVAPEIYSVFGVEESYFKRQDEVLLPLYRWKEHRIWGITARIIQDLVERMQGSPLQNR